MPAASKGAATKGATTKPDIEIAADHARRFLVRRHLLAPPRALAAEAASVLTVVERLGLLQFDPLEVPGARNHDLVLHNRIRDYRRGWAEQWLYGEDRRLIEVYNKSLNILPIEQLPHYAITWDHAQGNYNEGILREQSAVADAIVSTIEREGPLSTAAFKEHGHAIDWWWAPTPAARAVAEALFVTGRLGIARREGNRRYYDLIERLVPKRLLARRETEEEAHRHRFLSRYRAVGLLGLQAPADVIYSTGSAAQRAAWAAELLEAGTLLTVTVDGMRGTRLMLAEEESILEAAREPALEPPAVTFMAPLDPLVWDRRLLRDLFGFDYTWEVYVPAAKRRFGYYVLPLLFGDRLVGRIEPRYQRSTRRLSIAGIWFEANFEPMETPSFIPAMAEALRAYQAFVGATKVSWPRSRVARELAKAVAAER